MRKDPEQIFPKAMDYLKENADGSGVGLWQHAQDTLMEIDAVGRGGLLVDAPAVTAATMAEQNAGQLSPVIAFYTAENIISWRLKRVGSINKVVMVVLRETYEYVDEADEFTTYIAQQYRVLDIDENGNYRQRLYRFDKTDSIVGEVENFYPQLRNVPKGEIPFTFVGASNNDATVDDPPLLPLAELNIGHYRNSADNEENLFVVSQAMLIVAPSEKFNPEQWEAANPNGVKFGARRGVNVGPGGDAKLIQAAATNALDNALTKKEQQAIQIGAQLITPSQQITAESARLQRGADTSVMATIARNVSTAYEDCLKWVAQMMGLPDKGIEFRLNMEFFLQPMTAQDRQQWAADVQAGNMPLEAYWAAMRKSGVTDWTDADIKEGIENAPLPARVTPVTGEIPATANTQQGATQ